jgi:microcystin-dependent protein
MGYDLYPAVDEEYNFAPEVRAALATSTELRNQVVPMTETQRNNLAGDELWTGRLVLNTTTNRIDRYDGSDWVAMTTEPAGVVKMFAGATAPDFHALLNGAVVDRVGIHAALFGVIGTTYNTGGELSTQFRLPNMKGKVVVGVDAGQAEFNALGESGGAKTHTLTEAEMPSHEHAGVTGAQSANHQHNGTTGGQNADHSHKQFQINITPGTLGGGGGTLEREGYDPGGGRDTGGASATHGHDFGTSSENANHAHAIPTAGSDGAHNNLQPYVAMNYIITL